MIYPVSACCFIRNTFEGAYMLPESIAQFLPYVSEMVIVDLGSTDGTAEFLEAISTRNPKFRIIYRDSFPFEDAGVFAALANELIGLCKYQNILYWQSDEIWHENLLKMMLDRFEQNQYDLSFWRIQFANNFQHVKWFPHLVHRVGQKGSFEFNGDGMNTTRTWDAKICSSYGGEMFPKWGDLGQDGIKPYVSEMITDISLLGGFRDNIPPRRKMHAPFWHEPPQIYYYENGKQNLMAEHDWMTKALNDEDWLKPESPYNLPHILKYHVGRPTYTLRGELLEAIKEDKTEAFIYEA